MSEIIYIKNMVCPRCITSVENVFSQLKIEISNIKLGEVNTPSEINTKKKALLEKELFANGFELLKDSKAEMISKIKSLIIDQIHHQTDNLKVNFSTFISENLQQEYTSLSKLFSSVEGITIEKFILKQKIEKVKELLFYKELNLSEIAFKMNYSSTAHLSSQFKKETGMSPSEFKQNNSPNHKALDSI